MKIRRNPKKLKYYNPSMFSYGVYLYRPWRRPGDDPMNRKLTLVPYWVNPYGAVADINPENFDPRRLRRLMKIFKRTYAYGACYA